MTVFFKSWDQTWYGAIVFICLSFETYLGIICGCIPGVRPIASKIFPKILRTSANRSDGNTAGNKSWGNNIKSDQYSSSQMSNKGYREFDNIQVTKDIELSVTMKHARRGSDNQPLRGAGREEWARPEWNYRT
jgi:hypothetical protein